MTDPDSTHHPRTSQAHELVAVILLSLVAVLTAWCGFQASKWGGDSSVAFSEASAARIDAAGFESQARDARGLDLAVYAQWVVAEAHGDEELADYIEARFSPEFAAAFSAWEADGRVENGPFVREEYVPPGTEETAAALAVSDAAFQQALDFNEKGDNYSLITVLFALVLFLSAIAQRGIAVLASRIVLGLAGVLAAGGMVLLLTFPIRL
ncbi:hypothetical protein [Microbacterium sp. CFBP9034]|uniref:hypothetical protein n=1 Tax=Microbacterium sp. CFBP9034 TaxID=3096540 RepID=UPI002A6A7FB7|nr:hypothetical protein [Microbacterium sp. CFBP9034]MDY0910165.1 hypothetical protein [Microbacterium sp. CFBP9034]